MATVVSVWFWNLICSPHNIVPLRRLERYFIPEDGDEEAHPNVFLAPKPRQQGAPPTLRAVRDAFPLPGQYHFRFKSPLYPGADREKGAMAVWMDVTQDQQPVPTWKTGIVAKVTRISMEEDEDDDDEDFVRTPAPIPQQQQQHHAPPSQAPASHASSIGSNDHLDILGGASLNSGATNGNGLFDSQPPSAPASGGSLLDFGASPPATAPSAHADFLGMSLPPQQAQQQYQQSRAPPPPQQQQPPPQRPPPQQQQTMNSYSRQAQPFGDLGGWT